MAQYSTTPAKTNSEVTVHGPRSAVQVAWCEQVRAKQNASRGWLLKLQNCMETYCTVDWDHRYHSARHLSRWTQTEDTKTPIMYTLKLNPAFLHNDTIPVCHRLLLE